MKARSVRRGSKILILLVLAVAYYIYSSSKSVDHLDLTKNSETQHKVCIIGNSEKIENVLKIHKMWQSKFPSYWIIWGEDPNHISTTNVFGQSYIPIGVNLVFGNKNVTWADGILDMLTILQQNYVCEYIFTHDDDLFFYKSLKFYGERDKTPISEVLVDVLEEYSPAIASFPWEVGDETVPAMISMKRKFKSHPVSPLTGFDSGMVIYHSSIVKIFIPYSPNGEGGFVGKWSLCAHFLNFLAPLAFRSNAIRINTIEYKNLINIDNIPKNLRKEAKLNENGLIVHEESRHPYEYMMNDGFKTFITKGLRNPRIRWGRDLETYDVSWTVRVGMPPFNKWEILKTINEFYDIQHPLISNNEYFKTKFTPPEINKYAMENLMLKFTIHIFTETRLDSFERLWTSISIANPIDFPVTIYIHLDFNNQSIPASQNYLKYLKSLSCRHGNTVLMVNYLNKGKKDIVIDSWMPSSTDEYAIFLEDDTSVSVYFLEYAFEMVKRYFYGEDYDGAILGISLFNPNFNMVTNEAWEPKTEGKFYALAQPQSFGAIYGPIQWFEFLKWYIKNKTIDPVLPNAYTNRWNKLYSWKKYLLRFMHSNGKYLIYPAFPNSISMSTRYIIPSGLSKKDKKKQLKRPSLNISEVFSLKLDPNDKKVISSTGSKTNFNFYQSVFKEGTLNLNNWHTPKNAQIQAFNAYGQKVENVTSLRKTILPYTSFDKCTMIITVYNRHNLLKDRLSYYENLELLSKIVVIWNNLDVEPPILPPYKKPIVIIKQTKNSLNNRFKPYPEIETDCVINMDDDWNMPYNHMRQSIEVWRGGFFDFLVGHLHQGRFHGLKDGKWRYFRPQKYNKKTFHAVSIILPSGMVYHRKYLEMYTSALPQRARDIVDEKMNCDDLLFNFMIANATGKGPVVLNNWAKALTIGAGGLWSDNSHFSERDWCMDEFAGLFGGKMPLKYTTTIFLETPDKTVPNLNEFVSLDHFPTGDDHAMLNVFENVGPDVITEDDLNT